MNHADTIIAVSTPVHGAIRAIIRMSGELAFELIEQVVEVASRPLQHARTAVCRIRLVEGIAFDATVYPFRGPRSSTGENVIEVHVPASPYLVQAALRRLIELGARPAGPGEFTARAFFNGKLDLTSAEGVAATISATNRAELDAARQLLGGELARQLEPILDEVVRTLALIEVGIDFTEEDVSFISRADVERSLASIVHSLRTLTHESPRIERLSHEPRIVLSGRPNAGKSTLLNALAGMSRAVVSDVAGTTRDALSARVALRRGFITLIDVAGIEEAEDHSISRQMQESAQRQIETADAIVLLIDASDARPPITLARQPDLIVRSKADLGSVPRGTIGIDALHSAGLDELRARLDEIAFGSETGGISRLSINARHADAIRAALESTCRAQRSQASGAEIVAADLRLTLEHLGTILGNISPDDVLGRIFSSFCIGK